MPYRSDKPYRTETNPSARSADVRFTVPELLACWHVLDLGDPPLELELGSLGGLDPASHTASVKRALDGLAARGLADADGPRASLAAALRVLARPERTVDIRFAGSLGNLAALGAMAGPRGVLAVRTFATDTPGRSGAHRPGALPTESQVTVTAVPATGVPAALVALAGSLTAGPARPVNIPADLLDDATAATAAGADPGSHWRLADQLVGRGVDRADAQSLARMCGGITGVGQLGATGYHGGSPRRGPFVVAVHRAPAGDFVQLRRPIRPGRAATVSVAPVTADRLLCHLHDLLRTVPVVAA